MDEKATLSHRYQMFTLSATLFLVAIGFGIVIPIFPFLVRGLGASTFQLGLLATVYALMQFLCAPSWGSLSDRYGRKRILIIGMAGFGISYVLMGVATNYMELLLARVISGFLSSATFPTAMAFAADISSEKERGHAMGRMGGAMNLGFVFGPTIGGLLSPLGVQAPFFVGGALAALNCLLALVFLQEPLKDATRRPARRTSGWQNVRLALTGDLAPLFLIIFASMFSNSSLFTILALYLADKMGGNAAMAGLMFTVQGAVAAVCQWFVLDMVHRRWNEEGTVLRTLVIMAAGFLALSLATDVYVAVAAIVVVSVGAALNRPSLTSLVSKRTRLMQGATMGMQTSFDSLGRVLGPLWAGFVYAFRIESPYWSAAVTCLLSAIFFAWQMQKERTATSVAEVPPPALGQADHAPPSPRR